MNGSYFDALIKTLNISPDEATKALLSAFVPCQPGALRAAWASRKNYGEPPSTGTIWKIFEDADFRCVRCGGHHRLSIDHVNDNAFDNSVQNLQVLCFDCNRAKRNKGSSIKDHKLVVFKTVIELNRRLGRFPTNVEVKEALGIKDLSGALYMVKFLRSRLASKDINDATAAQPND